MLSPPSKPSIRFRLIFKSKIMISNKIAFSIVYTKTVTFANMSRREYFRSRYAHNKPLLNRSVLVEQYLETNYPDILKEARFFADTELQLQDKTTCNEPTAENVSVFENPVDTFEAIQRLLEPLDLPAEFFNMNPTTPTVETAKDDSDFPADTTSRRLLMAFQLFHLALTFSRIWIYCFQMTTICFK